MWTRTRVRILASMFRWTGSSVCKWIKDRRITSEKEEKKKTTTTTKTTTRTGGTTRTREVLCRREGGTKKRREARDLFARISTGGRCRSRFQGMHFAFGVFHGICSATGLRFLLRSAKPVTEVCYCFRGPRTVLAIRCLCLLSYLLRPTSGSCRPWVQRPSFQDPAVLHFFLLSRGTSRSFFLRSA